VSGQNGFDPVPTGWRCPLCGTVNAPWIAKCNCTPGCTPPNTVIAPLNVPWTGDSLLPELITTPKPFTTCEHKESP
jgi:hypothetical protein